MVPATSANNPTNDESPPTSHARAVSEDILMLATLVATATYAVGFNPPGGVCQDTNHAAGHLPGDPTLRSTDNIHYQVFFYANAAAFASSLMVVVLTLLLTDCHKDSRLWISIDRPLRFLMLAAMLAFTAAYVAGACRDKFTLLCFCGLMGYAFLSGTLHFFVTLRADTSSSPEELLEQRSVRSSFRKLMVPLSMFALTITYVAGQSTPGGFWDDSAGGGHRPGDAILKDRLDGKVLRVFFFCNSTAFVASLYGVFVVMCSKLLVRKLVLAYFNIGLLGLVIAYIIGSSRGRHTTVYAVCFLYVAVVAYIVIHVAVAGIFMKTFFRHTIQHFFARVSRYLAALIRVEIAQDSEEDEVTVWLNKAAERRRASDLVLLLAGLALGITYQAGLYPPGGLWPANADGHMAGDPILQTIDARRYNAFYYCNSLSFVASLVTILLVKKRFLHEHHALQAAMIVDSLGLIASYAIGSCRDQVSTMYAVGLAGASVLYVVVHVSYFTLRNRGAENKDDDALVKKKMGGRSLLLAILVASITYQAGLTPPGGFLLEDDHPSGHHAGDPVLLYNYPRRYRGFFYCNTVSFIMSIILILLHVNPTHYKPAKRSDALSVCSAVSFICLMGAFGAGGTQHVNGSNYIAFLAAVAFIVCLVLLFLVYREKGLKQDDEPEDTDMPRSSSRKRAYLMTLGILVASVTYQAGLDQPGGSWQSSGDGHDAGNPVMHDNSRQRYLTFFYANSTSFAASVYLIALLMLRMFWKSKWCTMAIDATVVPQCLGLLLAYASGSSRKWKTSVYVGTLVAPVLVYIAVHVTLSIWTTKRIIPPSQRLVVQ